MKKKKIIPLALIIMIICGIFSAVSLSGKKTALEGRGTKNNPYLIQDTDDLLIFADLVNSGNNFKGQYVYQTQNLDLADIIWPVIAPYELDYTFDGIYNGGGHYIKNLTVTTDNNNSFFGKLGGTVMNLGIIDSEITGACVGGITTHASNSNALIINCYTRADITGIRAGGIADNFNGTIANCFSNCTLHSGLRGGIVSYNVTQSFHNFSVEPEDFDGLQIDNCTILSPENYDKENLVAQLNDSLYEIASNFNIDHNFLHYWEIDDSGEIGFSTETAQFNIHNMPSTIVAYLPQISAWILVIIIFVFSYFLFRMLYKKSY